MSKVGNNERFDDTGSTSLGQQRRRFSYCSPSPARLSNTNRIRFRSGKLIVPDMPDTASNPSSNLNSPVGGTPPTSSACNSRTSTCSSQQLRPPNNSRERRNSFSLLFNKTNEAAAEKVSDQIEKLARLSSRLKQYEADGLPVDESNTGVEIDPAFQLEVAWTDLVPDTELISRHDKSRMAAVWELIMTEFQYIKSVRLIVDLFVTVLGDLQNNYQLLTEIDLSRLCSNVREVYVANRRFWLQYMYSMIKAARVDRKAEAFSCSRYLADAFLHINELFKPYRKFCSEQADCVAYLKSVTSENELFRAFLTWAESRTQCKRQKFADLLVVPMQRLTKYNLLLSAIMKLTDDQTESCVLAQMINSTERFISAVNEEVRHHEEVRKLEGIISKIESYDVIEPHAYGEDCAKLLEPYCQLDLFVSPTLSNSRELLFDGWMRLRDCQTKMEVCCLLFSDMLLITKASSVRTKVSSASCSGSASSLSPTSPTLSAMQHSHQCTLRIIKQPVRLDKLVIVELKDSCCAIFVILSDFGCTASNAYFMSADNMSIWIKRIRHAQDEYAKDTKRQQGRSSGSDSAGSCTGHLVTHRSRRRAGSPLSRVRQPVSSSPPTSPSTTTPSPTTPVAPSSDVASPVTAVLCGVSGYLASENTPTDDTTRCAAKANGAKHDELSPNDARCPAAALLDADSKLSARRRSSTINRPLIDRVPEIHILAETPTQNSPACPLETNRAHCSFVYAVRNECESESDVDSGKKNRNGTPCANEKEKEKNSADCKLESKDLCKSLAFCPAEGAAKRLGRFASLRSRLLRKSQKHLVKATLATRTNHASMRKKLSNGDAANCLISAPRSPRRPSWQFAAPSGICPSSTSASTQSPESTPSCSTPPPADPAAGFGKLAQPVLHRKHVYVTNAVTSSESTRSTPLSRSFAQKTQRETDLYKVHPGENLRARLHNWTATHLHNVFSPGQRKARRTASVNQASVSTNSSQEAADLAMALGRTSKSGPGTPLRPRSHSSCKGRVSGNAQCPGYMFTVGI